MKDTKICSDCKQELPVTEFYLTHDKKVLGKPRRSYCKKCSAIRRKDFRQRRKQRLQENRKILIMELLAKYGVSDCDLENLLSEMLKIVKI